MAVTITIFAKTMDGNDASDPKVTVDVIQITPIHKLIHHRVYSEFSGKLDVVLPMPDDFPTWQVNVSFSRFDAVTGMMFQPRGKSDPQLLVKVARLPGKWAPTFTRLKKLASPRFDPFRAVVAVSDDVDLKRGAVGDLNAVYDTLATPAQVLAKMALLNLFAVLSDEIDPISMKPWFSFVRKIVRIDGERFIAETDPELFENVNEMVKNLASVFAAQGYSTEPALDFLLHYGNIPARYDVKNNLLEMATVKRRYRQGDMQLTVMSLKVDGNPVHLLDCDMDENANILLHGFDLAKHLVSGGTSPIAMHEYIEETSALAAPDHLATIDLGYELV